MRENSNNNDVEELFLNQKPARILAYLKAHRDGCVAEISRQIDSTYSHTAKTMYRLEDHDLVRSEKTGRKTMYELTRKGEELAKDFVELFRTMGASVPPSAPKLG